MNNRNQKVIRGLKSRHMSMIAIGGCIGTGLFMASGEAINSAGAGGALVAYFLVGAMVYFLMNSLGEMATYLPVSGAWCVYANRFVDQSLGFALGWNYWFNWVITVAVDVTVAAIVISYWQPMQVLPYWVWSLIFFFFLFFMNFLSVKAYGESEFWFAIIKVVTIFIFLFIGVLTIFGILGGEYIGLKNLTIENAPFLGENTTNKFINMFGVFIIAGFSFQGTELIGIAAGESKDPKKDIPKSIRQVFWRILLFYVLTIFIIGIIIPYNDPNLLGADVSQIAKSPFTIVLEKSGIALAAAVMNAVILTSVISAANSGMYASVRMLYALSLEKQAHPIFSNTNAQGTPIFALLLTAFVSFIMIVLNFFDKNTLQYIISASGITGFIAWLGIAVSHYKFRKAYRAQGKDLNDLTFKAKLFPLGSFFTFILCAVIIICQDTELILAGKFNALSFCVSYIGIPFFLLFYIYHKIKYKTRPIDPIEANLNQEPEEKKDTI